MCDVISDRMIQNFETNKPSEKRKSLSIQAAWHFIGRASAFVVTFLIPVILVRIFTENDFGVYRKALLIVFFVERILEFGLRHSFFYFLPRDFAKRASYIANALCFWLCTGLINIFFLYIFRESIACFMRAPELASLMHWVGIYILMILLSCSFESILVIDSKAKKASAVMFLSETVRGVFTVTSIVLFGSLYWIFAVLAVYSTIRCLAFIVYVLRTCEFNRHCFKYSDFDEQFRYTAPIGLATLVGTLGKRIERFIVSAMFTSTVFAVYSIGRTQVPFINMLFTTVGEVVMPRMVEHLKAHKINAFLELWQKLQVKMLFVGIGSFFLLHIIAKDLITFVYTEKFSGSVPVFRIILFLILSNSIRYGLILRSLGETKDVLVSNVIALITAVIITYPLIRFYDIKGAAFSSVLVFNANVISQLFFSARKLKIKFIALFPVTFIVKCVCLAGSIFIIVYYLQSFCPFRFGRIVLSAVLYLTLYVTMCYKTGIFNIFAEPFLKKIMFSLKRTRI